MACPSCTEGSFLPGDPTGSIQPDFSGAYYAAAPGGVENAGKPYAIILLSDGFGLPLKNCKILADNLAQRLECDVWVPDYFNGKPLIDVDKDWGPDRAGIKPSAFDWIKFVFTTGIPKIPAFIANRPNVVDKRVAEFIALVKEKKKYKKFGVVGYCFGGSTTIRIAGTDLISTAVICHPGPFSIKEVEDIKVPTSWVCPEEDLFLSQKTRLAAEATLTKRKQDGTAPDFEFKDYKGTVHGFAARPNLNLPEIKEAYEKSFEQTVKWLKKTLL